MHVCRLRLAPSWSRSSVLFTFRHSSPQLVVLVDNLSLLGIRDTEGADLRAAAASDSTVLATGVVLDGEERVGYWLAGHQKELVGFRYDRTSRQMSVCLLYTSPSPRDS